MANSEAKTTPIEFVFLNFNNEEEYKDGIGAVLDAIPDGPQEAVERQIGLLRVATADHGNRTTLGAYIRNKAQLESFTCYPAHEMERLLHIIKVFDDCVSNLLLFQ